MPAPVSAAEPRLPGPDLPRYGARDIERGTVRATRELFGVDQDHIPRANGCRRLSEQRQLGESRLCVSN